MSFTVEWLPDAEQELAAIWLSAPDRSEVTRAADAIDRQLQVDPINLGESRPSGRRIHFVRPLAVIFRVYPDQLLVTVVNVWQFKS